MTQHVQQTYQRHRRAFWASWGVVGAILAAAALAVVIPATAQTGDILPGSLPGEVIPTLWTDSGGGNFSCASVSAAATNTFSLSSVTSGTYTATATNGRAVTIGIKVPSTGSPSVRNKWMSFRIVGGRISDIGIKGGSNVAWYEYGDAANQWEEADGYGNGSSTISNLDVSTENGLHAPRDNSGNLYSINGLTICYEATIKISGYVYRDTNANGTKDSGEPGLSGRSVTLPGGSVTTDSSGLYEAFVAPGTYTLCSAAQSGEVQTQPAPGASCTGKGGWTADYTSDTADQNFGFTGGVVGACAAENGSPLSSSLESGNATVVAKFQSVNGVCKVQGSDLAFTTYVEGGVRIAHLHPVGSLGTAPCDMPTGLRCQVVAQKITWNLPTSSPDTSTLRYDDPPFNVVGVDPRPMKFCLKNPLTSDADGVTLQPVASGYFPNQILPSTETSCLIRTTQGPGPSPKRVDQVYSAYDGKSILG